MQNFCCGSKLSDIHNQLRVHTYKAHFKKEAEVILKMVYCILH